MLGQGDTTSTWLPADKIPPSIIKEYEKDIHPEVDEVVTQHSGQYQHTFSTVYGSSAPTKTLLLEGNDGYINRYKILYTCCRCYYGIFPRHVVVHRCSNKNFPIPRVFSEHPDDKLGLRCNTEKDKGVRLHHRSAGVQNIFCHTSFMVYNMHGIGILAGVWPCGVITLIGELFIAEAKTQVYGFLHSIIDNNRAELSNLGRLHFYILCSVYTEYSLV